MRHLFLLLLLSAPMVLAAQDGALSGKAWLEKADDAMQSLAYQGTVVFLKNGRVDTMKYRHLIENNDEIETLTSLNSPLREVTRRSSRVSCLFKETSEEVKTQHPTDRSFIVNLPTSSHHLDEQYLLATAGQEMVAMRPTRVVAILPKDDLRYARKIWLDNETHLPLRSEVYGLDGDLLEQVMFADLVVNPVPGEPSLHVKHTDYHEHLKAEAEDTFNKSRFQLGYWPAGFDVMFFADKAMQKSKKTVEHLLLSDGFSNISIYFEASDAQGRGLEGPRTLGAVNSFSRLLGDTQVTVLGEVPAKTVELVAKGIALR